MDIIDVVILVVLYNVLLMIVGYMVLIMFPCAVRKLFDRLYHSALVVRAEDDLII